MGKLDERRVEAQAAQLVTLVPRLMVGLRSVLGDAPRELHGVERPSPRHLAVLLSLSGAGPASVSDLAARMNLTLTHTSQIVGELAGGRLVERTEDQRDRRRTIASITPDGTKIVDAVSVGAARPLQGFCGSLTAEEGAQFIAHMGTLVSFLTASGTRPTKADARGVQK